jgi:hypothetical protein
MLRENEGLAALSPETQAGGVHAALSISLSFARHGKARKVLQEYILSKTDNREVREDQFTI